MRAQEVTIEQAAEILNVSYAYVKKLLDERRLPFFADGPDRLVHVADLLAFKQTEEAERRVALAELTLEAEKLGLGY